jgi:hypothetical protein
MATVQRYCNTASSGGDGTTNNTSGATAAFVSQFSAESNMGGSATDDYVLDCCGVAADTTSVNWDFTTNLTTGTINVRSNRSDPAGFYDGPLVISDQHYRLSAGDVLNGIRVSELNTTIDGIQLIAGHTTSNGIGISTSNGGFTVKNCRVLNIAATQYGIGNPVALGGGSTDRTIENNLVVGFVTQQIYTNVAQFFAPTVNVFHNTCYGNGSSGGIRVEKTGNSGAVVINVKANAVANNAIGISSSLGSGTLSSADNASADSTGEITGISAAAAWTSPGTSASSDFTILDTGPLYNAVNPTLVPEDITGFPRDGTNHDVGCFEFQSVGGTTEYTITPSGGVTFSGSATLLKGRVFITAGGVTFAGEATYETHSASRTITPSGGVVLSGTADVIFDGNGSFVITPSGGVVFSGGTSLVKGKILTADGTITFSGTAGLVTHTASRVITPSGGVVFSGTADVRYTAFGVEIARSKGMMMMQLGYMKHRRYRNKPDTKGYL